MAITTSASHESPGTASGSAVVQPAQGVDGVLKSSRKRTIKELNDIVRPQYRKRGLDTLPPDAILEIAALLHPHIMWLLSRTCKTLRRALTSGKDARLLWKQSLLRTWPELSYWIEKPERNLIALARLLHGYDCHACGGKPDFTDFLLDMRLCAKCRPAYMIPYEQAKALAPELSAQQLAVFGNDDGAYMVLSNKSQAARRQGGKMFYDKGALQRLMKDFRKKQRFALETRSTFTYLIPRGPHAIKTFGAGVIAGEFIRRGQGVKEDHERIRAENLRFIEKRLQVEEWCLDDMPFHDQGFMCIILQPEPITIATWRKIYYRLLPFLTDYRDLREELASQQIA